MAKRPDKPGSRSGVSRRIFLSRLTAVSGGVAGTVLSPALEVAAQTSGRAAPPCHPVVQPDCGHPRSTTRTVAPRWSTCKSKASPAYVAMISLARNGKAWCGIMMSPHDHSFAHRFPKRVNAEDSHHSQEVTNAHRTPRFLEGYCRRRSASHDFANIRKIGGAS